MTYTVAYGHPTVLAARGLTHQQALNRAHLVVSEGRPDVRVVDDRGNLIISFAVEPTFLSKRA